MLLPTESPTRITGIPAWSRICAVGKSYAVSMTKRSPRCLKARTSRVVTDMGSRLLPSARRSSGSVYAGVGGPRADPDVRGGAYDARRCRTGRKAAPTRGRGTLRGGARGPGPGGVRGRRGGGGGVGGGGEGGDRQGGGGGQGAPRAGGGAARRGRARGGAGGRRGGGPARGGGGGGGPGG